MMETYTDVRSDVLTYTVPKHLLVDDFGVEQTLLLSHPDVALLLHQ